MTSGANNNLNNATKGRKRGKVATRHLKKVKVPAKLRKQIKTVTENKGSRGRRVQLWNNHLRMQAAQPLAQRHFFFNNVQASGLLGEPMVHFTPLQTMHSAAVMFNSKTVTQDYEVTTGNFGNTEDAVFDIVSQKATYVIKNNSQRHYTLNITIMSPKNNTDAEASMTIDDAIAADVASGEWNGTATVGPSKANLACDWQSSPTLRRNYVIERQQIKIDPGASTSFVVTGWSGRFNWKKSLKQDQPLATDHWLYPKGDTKFVAIDAVCNLVAITSDSSTGFAGRWISLLPTSGASLLVEIKEEIVMLAPNIKPVIKNSTTHYWEDYTSQVITTDRVIQTQNPDDEATGLYQPQDD